MLRFALLVVLASAATAAFPAAPEAEAARRAPEFSSATPEDWLNSPPLKLADFSGQVVLLEFWTYGCGNCRRSIPWLRGLEQKFGDRGLRVVGVHTPEFPHERSRAEVAARVKAYGIGFPVMLDNDGEYWRAIGNHFWPTFYLVDKRGLLRAALAGQTIAGDFNARTLEAFIEELLGEAF